MNSQNIRSVIQLMENNEVVHTIEIESIDDYEFYFDSEKLSSMCIVIPKLKMEDLGILVKKPYDHYVVFGTKTVLDKTKRTFAIPAKVFDHMVLEDRGMEIKIHFNKETKDEG